MKCKDACFGNILIPRFLSPNLSPPIYSFAVGDCSRQVPRDVFKATPIVVAFMIPIVGTLAPLVSLVFQKALLPAQFWSWSQHRNYMMQVKLKAHSPLQALGYHGMC